VNAHGGGINGAYRQGFVDALRGAAGGVTSPEIARGLAADATLRRGRAYWLGAARGLRQSDREANAAMNASDLVFPARNLSDRLHAYAKRNIRPGGGDPRGYPLYSATQALENAERTLRTLYSPSYDGL